MITTVSLSTKKNSNNKQNKALRTMSLQRILIIRLSSFGDIVQTLPTVDILSSQNVAVDYYTKPEFKCIIEPHPGIDKKYYFDKKKSLWSELRELKKIIEANNYSVIYDAHRNNRTFIFRIMTLPLRIKLNFLCKFKQKNSLSWVIRPKNRLRRALYFKFKMRNVFNHPMIAAESFLKPVIDHNLIPKQSALPVQVNNSYNAFFNSNSNKSYIALGPSAAWPLKRWPTEYFIELTKIMPNFEFVILGGPEDNFAKTIQGSNVLNLVGKLKWAETGSWILNASLVLAADTGILHWADYMGVKTVGLLGPTAFGQPFRSTTHVLNKNLACSPCTKDGRGACKIKETQKCLKDIRPLEVKNLIENIIKVQKA